VCKERHLQYGKLIGSGIKFEKCNIFIQQWECKHSYFNELPLKEANV